MELVQHVPDHAIVAGVRKIHAPHAPRRIFKTAIACPTVEEYIISLRRTRFVRVVPVLWGACQ